MIQRYAKVNGDTLIKYPYLFSDLQAENLYTNYGDNFDVAFWFPQTQLAIETGDVLVAVEEKDKPTFNIATQNCVLKNDPVFIYGKWIINWVVSEKTLEEKQQAIEDWRNTASCTPFQGRMALSDAGLLTQAQALVDAGDEKTKTAWEYALEWRRGSAMIATLGAALGLSDVQIDDLFREARQISV